MKFLLSLSIAAVLLTGCAEPTVLDPPFGESVRHMIALQTADPSREAPGLDGEKSRKAFDAYREQTGTLDDLGDLGDIGGN
ncbi:hypothetical protein [Halochromatium salexigens]|uniref:Lipoprotein n=1 Tax=Halochromatium salexigens TaxID=49447 RepID=A0AAJ0XGV7_HALSE|nr:hypothetical protein [Halochromatium salexigens]MBK5931125.1 hypothetical protein [Halochromatium salexigens]